MKKTFILAILIGGLVLVVGYCFWASNMHYHRGSSYLNQSPSNPVSAEKELRMATRLNPFNANVHYGFGNALAAQAKDAEAVKEYRIALQLKQKVVYPCIVHWELGGSLRRLGKLEEAEKEYREAIRLMPNQIHQPDIHDDLASLLMEKGKYIEAEQEARLISYNWKQHTTLAEIFYKQGRFAEAENEYRANIQDNPNKYWGYSDLGNLLAREGKFKAAEDTLLQGLRLQPDDMNLLWDLGCCYALWGKKEKAIDCLQKAADKGFGGWADGLSNVAKDTRLDGLRGDPRFDKIAEKVKENWERFKKYPPLLL